MQRPFGQILAFVQCPHATVSLAAISLISRTAAAPLPRHLAALPELVGRFVATAEVHQALLLSWSRGHWLPRRSCQTSRTATQPPPQQRRLTPQHVSPAHAPHLLSMPTHSAGHALAHVAPLALQAGLATTEQAQPSGGVVLAGASEMWQCKQRRTCSRTSACAAACQVTAQRTRALRSDAKPLIRRQAARSV